MQRCAEAGTAVWMSNVRFSRTIVHPWMPGSRSCKMPELFSLIELKSFPSAMRQKQAPFLNRCLNGLLPKRMPVGQELIALPFEGERDERRHGSKNNSRHGRGSRSSVYSERCRDLPCICPKNEIGIQWPDSRWMPTTLVIGESLRVDKAAQAQRYRCVAKPWPSSGR